MATTTVDVVLSVIDRLTRPISAIQNRINRLTAPVQRVGRALGDIGRASGIDRLAGRLGNVTSALGGVTREAGAALGKLTAMAGVSLAGVTASLYGVLRTGGEFERYTVMLTGLFDGDTDAARGAMSWAQRFAETTNLGVDQAVDAFVQLKNVGIDPTLGALQSLTDYNARVGGNFERLQGITTAITQMWGKGKIQAEEMMQLTDRQVPSWQLLSRATGKTVAQLQELGTKGDLGPDYIRALVTQMGKESVGASEAFGKTWFDILDRMRDSWLTFNKSVAEAGVFDSAKESLETLLATVQRMAGDGTLQAWAKNVSDAMTTYLVKPLDEFLFGRVVAMEGLEEPMRVGGFISDLPMHMETLGTAARTVSDALVTFADAIGPVVDLVGGPLNAGLLALGAITFGPLIASLLTLSGAVIMFGTALLTTPVGWFLGAVAAIGAAVYLIYRNWDGIVGYFSGVWDRIKGAFDGGLASLAAAILEFSPATHFMRAINALVEYLTGVSLFDVGAALVDSMWEGIKFAFEGMKNGLLGLIDDMTSRLPKWARTSLAVDVDAPSPPTTPSIFAGEVPVGGADAQGTANRFVGEVPTGPTPPSMPTITLPEIVVPSFPSPASPSSISTSSVDASSINVSNFTPPEPIIAHQPQNVTVNATINVGGISGLGLTEPEVRAIMNRESVALANRVRAATLSALED